MKFLSKNNISFFQSDLLNKHNIYHSFFTKRLNKNEPGELQKELNLNSNINFLKQVHSNRIIKINNMLDLKPKIGDCLITNKRNQSLWIYTADCIPILIADVTTRSVAALHSGLKGIKKNIISKALKSFIEIGSNKNDLIIAIGPCIKGERYQVKIKDVDNLIIQLSGKSHIKKSRLIYINNKEKIPLFKKCISHDRLFFDIQAAAILQLHNEGIKQSQINVNRLCTYSNPKLFNSFRRNSTKLRQWSCIYS